MKEKILLLAIIASLVITIPIVASTLTENYIIHVNGNTRYPHFVPPPPTPEQTSVAFSLFYPNGTTFPTSTGGTLSGGVNTVVVDPITGHNGGWIPTCVVIRNDGNVPIAVNATATNISIPSDMTLDLNCNYYGTIDGMFESDKATSQQPIQPGQVYYMSLMGLLTPNNADYLSDQTFNYSYDVVVTAAQS